MSSTAVKRLLLGGTAATAAVGAAAWGVIQLGMPEAPLQPEPWADTSTTTRSRKEQLKNLRAGKEFDVLIIGGACVCVSVCLCCVLFFFGGGWGSRVAWQAQLPIVNRLVVVVSHLR